MGQNNDLNNDLNKGLNNVFMDATAKQLNEGALMRYFLGKTNSRGWSVIYVFLQVGEVRIRLSLGCKVKREYWNNGKVRLPFACSRVEKYVHEEAIKRMEEASNNLDEIVYNYLIGNGVNDIVTEVRTYLNSFNMTKKRKKIMLSLLWKQILGEEFQGKTLDTYTTKVNVFKNFMEANNIEDDIEALTTDNIRKFKEWLIGYNKSASYINQLLTFVNAMCIRMKQRGFSHNVDFECIPKIKSIVSTEEKTEGNVSLYHDEIEKLRKLELTETKELVRDLFLIQCFCGCRFEDLGLVLDEKTLVNGEMLRFKPEKTRKHGTTSRVPLTSYYPQLRELWEKHKGYNNNVSKETYRRNIKAIAKIANLDREITVVKQLGVNNKVTEIYKVYEVISSHDGRHTFITNMLRYFKLTPSQIIPMSGHTTTDMIEKVYASLTKEDKDLQVMEVAKNATNNVVNVNSNVPEMSTNNVVNVNSNVSTMSNEPNIKDKVEAIRVLSYLGVSLTSKDIEVLDFNDLCRMIEMKHSDLMDNYGIDVTELKDIFNFHKPMIVRRELLKRLIEMMKG